MRLSTRRTLRALLSTTALLGLVAGLMLQPAANAAGDAGLDAPPAPVDGRSWVLPQDMKWRDYRPIPGFDWNDPSRQPAKKLRAALILGDFQDQDFVATLARGADEAGNPQVPGVTRDEVADFYKGFLLTEPQKLNHFHAANEYWLEDTYGLIGIDADAFGPYRMAGNEAEYGLSDYNSSACPSGDTCNKDFDTELTRASLADVNAAIVTNGGHDYDFRFLLHAGYDESGVWQEFGEMKFPTKEDVTEEFGNPDPTKPNWATTRYVDWTSYWAATGIWSHAIPGALATEGENDGSAVYAHEFSHILGVLDNYNNPYGVPVRRSYSGPWDMMSRGSFNGPGGNHNRWQIPPTLGATMGSHHMLRNKLRMGFLKPGEVLFTTPQALAASGPVFADVWAREIPLGPTVGRTGLHGIQIVLPNGDQSPPCTVAQDWRCDGGGYQNYTVEVVDRMGMDSFTPDHGVLLAKTKNADTSPFIWVVDAHPDDIDKVDFVRPDGTPAKVSLGDYRQLADALFHAGTGKGVVSEWEDVPNRLHFYVLGLTRDADGVLRYRVAVRSLDGAGPYPRAVEVTAGDVEQASPGRVAVATFHITNPGTATDLYRLAPAVDRRWATTLAATVIEVPAGATVDVPVYVSVPARARGPQTLSLTVTSETDPSKTAAASATITPAP